MEPNRRNRSPIRIALVWCLLALWLTGSVQASVHVTRMAGETAQLTTVALSSHMEAHGAAATHDGGYPAHQMNSAAVAEGHNAHTSGAQADGACVELCLLMSLAPSLLSLSQAGPKAPQFVQPLGIPAGLAQPAVPPPKPLPL